MKIKIIAIMSLIFACFMFGGCKSKGSEDTTYTSFLTPAYNYAMLKLPDGTIVKGKINLWSECSHGIIINLNGLTYLTSMANVILMEVEE